jgi:hypothetical protein
MLVGIALLSAAVRAQRVGDSLLQDALELGRRGEPIPYTLHMNSAGSGDAGKVYTPFVRVAMASRTALLSGNELSVSDLPDWLTQPTTYVTVRWYCTDDEGCALPAGPIAVRLLRPRLPPLAPVWVSRDFELLRRFGADKPSADTVLIAAFAVASVTAGSMVEACVQVDERTCKGRSGVITQRDVDQWK